MRRPTWILLLGAAFAHGALPTAGQGAARIQAPAGSAPSPPNFVVLLADDLGWGDLEPFGQRTIATPRLARMAQEGLVLRQFYSGAPVCPPAREALLTGLHTGHTLVRTEGTLPGDSAAAPRYLPRRLAAAGYVSGMFGKWGMGAYRVEADGSATATAGRPHRLGFAEFLGTMTHRDAHTYTLPPFPLRPTDERIHGRLWTIRDGATREAPATATLPYTQEAYAAAALDFVRRHRDRPFLLYLPWTIPHAELYLPADDPAWELYLDASGGSRFPETPWAGDRLFRRPNPKPRASYAAMVTRLDRDVGRLLDLLDELDLAAQTLVVVTSDNGPHSAGGLDGPAFFASTGGLAGAKFELTEGGIRIPAILRWQGTIAPGREIEEPFALWDLAPTLLELAGLARPAGLDGLSLAPLVRGQPQRPHDAAFPLYWETFTNVRGQALRNGPWKLVRDRLRGPDDPVHLYHLPSDPGETRDLAAEPRTCRILADLVRRLDAARRDPGGAFSFPPLAAPCPPGPPYPRRRETLPRQARDPDGPLPAGSASARFPGRSPSLTAKLDRSPSRSTTTFTVVPRGLLENVVDQVAHGRVLTGFERRLGDTRERGCSSTKSLSTP